MTPKAFRTVMTWLSPLLALAFSPPAYPSSQSRDPLSLKQKLAFTIKSPAFTNGASVPKKHTGEGQDISPPLSWSGVPKGTKQFILICEDPDAPQKNWVHWVIYEIPGSATSLAERIPTSERPAEPKGSLQGKNSWGTIGYRGPLPPPGSGAHRYRFRLFAIDTILGLKPGLDAEAVMFGMSGHVLTETVLEGTYKR